MVSAYLRLLLRVTLALLTSCMVSSVVAKAPAADIQIALTGTPSVVYDPYDRAHGACSPVDAPDMPARAFHDASGGVAMFALQLANRPLRGPNADTVTIDCHASLDSPFDPNPAKYADRYWVTSTWTSNGTDVSAIVHHEYHAEAHDRCAFKEVLPCWYNTILAFQSNDSGSSFVKADPLVVAAVPFRQDVGQGRHRGFFEPSNMFSDGTFVYFLSATTGWPGQDPGVCLFRSTNPSDPALWRAYDGKSFSIRYADPYRSDVKPPPCKTIEPFSHSVGSVVRHAASGTWIAVFEAPPSGRLPVNGFYYSTSKDLFHWSFAKLLWGGPTATSDLCKSGPVVANYPSLLDPHSTSRNFDVIGDHPMLYYTTIAIENCQMGRRMLVRQPINLTLHDLAETQGR